MRHIATRKFWAAYERLPVSVRSVADKNFKLLKENSRHRSLQFKRIGDFWSVRVGLGYRALGVDTADGIVWFWIGPHDAYEDIIRS